MVNTVWRFLLSAVLAAGFLLGGCSSAFAGQDSWAVCIYMCGSDLESEHGAATANLEALKKVRLPENVRFLIQTGGAEKWHAKGIPGNALGRYVFDHTGLHELEKMKDASMGDEKTLEDFLRFSREQFPAEHRMLIFWDHGGGSLGGFCWDEKYRSILSLQDLRNALEATCPPNPESPVFDLVLFDTCLMANIETANTLYGYARYLAASEEIMPSEGTDYAGWAGALARNPSMSGKELGIAVSETYLPYCKLHECDDMATLSLIDLGKLPALNAAYEKMGQEALQEARRNPRHFFTAFDRVANSVENYGPNDGEDWTNMVDLGALSDGMDVLPAAPAVVQAVKDAVVYRAAGPYRRYGMGLSGYYSLDGNIASWQTYASLPGASPVFSKFYRDMLSGSGDGEPWFHFDAAKIADAPVTIGPDNVASVALSPEDANSISNASFWLCSYDKDNHLVFLGSDDKLEANWEQGVFRESFDGMWPALNGHFLSMYLREQQKDYNLYVSYLLLNGKKCCLTAVYDFGKEAFEITGVRRILKDGLLDRQNLPLKKGDKITPLFLDEEAREVKGESFVMEGDPVLRDEALPDGAYAFAFRFDTVRNEEAVSETIHFVIENGEMTVVKD